MIHWDDAQVQRSRQQTQTHYQHIPFPYGPGSSNSNRNGSRLMPQGHHRFDSITANLLELVLKVSIPSHSGRVVNVAVQFRIL